MFHRLGLLEALNLGGGVLEGLTAKTWPGGRRPAMIAFLQRKGKPGFAEIASFVMSAWGAVKICLGRLSLPSEPHFLRGDPPGFRRGCPASEVTPRRQDGAIGFRHVRLLPRRYHFLSTQTLFLSRPFTR